jgi:hypothetical protein
MALPGTGHREFAFPFGETSEVEQRQYRSVNLVEVRVHNRILTKNALKGPFFRPNPVKPGSLTPTGYDLGANRSERSAQYRNC